MRKFEFVQENKRNFNIEDLKLPTRSDKGSAGYDFYLPCDVNISPKGVATIPMDIKVKMEEDEVLMLYVRSSIGIKKQLMLMNGTGVIDSTYYNNETNDGNIMCALYNYGDSPQFLSKGERIMQGVFVKYLITEDDKPINEKRVGGIGSSGK